MVIGGSTASMSEQSFEFDHVSRSYGAQPALSDISFTLATGQHTAILGCSGSGKSTLLRLLAGLEAPTSGRIMQDGKVASEKERVSIPPHMRRLSMVFQDLALWPNLTAESNVLLALSSGGLRRREALARVHEAMDLCGISHLARRRPGQISGGEQQRVALARAIVGRPKFLLLDEPFAGIDVLTKARIISEIAELAVTQQLTMVLVSHDPREATQLCSYAVVLEQGRVRQAGELNAVFDNPACEFVRAFRDLYSQSTDATDTNPTQHGPRKAPFAATRVPRELGE